MSKRVQEKIVPGARSQGRHTRTGEETLTKAGKSMFCDKCGQAGLPALAQYVLLADVDELIGDKTGDRDAETMAFLRWPRLCRFHHSQLPEDARMAYVPTADTCPEL